MRKLTLILLLATLLIAMAVIPAFAHIQVPCNSTPEPGNSAYAKHHIAPLAKAGLLGNDGHKPGTHGGFSLCNPSGK